MIHMHLMINQLMTNFRVSIWFTPCIERMNNYQKEETESGCSFFFAIRIRWIIIKNKPISYQYLNTCGVQSHRQNIWLCKLLSVITLIITCFTYHGVHLSMRMPFFFLFYRWYRLSKSYCIKYNIRSKYKVWNVIS